VAHEINVTEETNMKAARVIGTGVLLLLFGAVAPMYAQQDQHDQDSKDSKQDQQAKPEKQPEKQQDQAKPAQPEQKQQEQAKSTQQNDQKQVKTEQAQTKSNDQEQEKSANQAKQNEAKSQEQAKSTNLTKQNEAKSQEQSRSNGQPQRSVAEQQRQRSAPALRLSVRGEGRIPDDRFSSNFGSGHRFRIGSPRMVDGYSRFNYGGYWFGFVQPWPVGWYYTDDVYVDYVDGGYYLYNPYYPGARVSINVVL
jgi:hypothetical protein